MRLLTLFLLCLFTICGVVQASDLYRDPPPPKTFTRILTRGAVTQTTDLLFQEGRNMKQAPDDDVKLVRQIQAVVATLVCIGRRTDASFLAGRLLKALHKQRPRNLYEIARVHNLLAFIHLGTGFRVLAEAPLRQALEFGNRVRGQGNSQVAGDALFLAGLLKALNYPFMAKIMRDQAKGFENTRRRRYGGVRPVRAREVHNTRVPAMTFRTLKDELLGVDESRRTVEEARALLPQVRAFALQDALTRQEFHPGELEVLKVMDRLSRRRISMKEFLFQLRRSGDDKVADVREHNLEDFREIYADLASVMEELMANLLIARMNNGI
jgi:hypothetical protein